MNLTEDLLLDILKFLSRTHLELLQPTSSYFYSATLKFENKLCLRMLRRIVLSFGADPFLSISSADSSNTTTHFANSAEASSLLMHFAKCSYIAEFQINRISENRQLQELQVRRASQLGPLTTL